MHVHVNVANLLIRNTVKSDQNLFADGETEFVSYKMRLLGFGYSTKLCCIKHLFLYLSNSYWSLDDVE